MTPTEPEPEPTEPTEPEPDVEEPGGVVEGPDA
jgi:hypothetical protein